MTLAKPLQTCLTSTIALAFCATLSWGAPVQAACDDLPDILPVINEVLYDDAPDTPSMNEFIEIKGAAGMPLDCYVLRGYNGGSDASNCDKYMEVSLEGQVIGANGYWVGADDDETLPGADMENSKLDLQNGPDVIALVFISDGDVELIMDALTYGENLSSCESDLKEGDAATAPPEGQSLSRCPDGDDYDDNSDDFATTLNPTPGEENTCPAPKPPCDGSLPIIINELVVDTALADDEGAYIELKGPPGANLGCYSIIAMNGNGCLPYATLPLQGQYIAGDGYFVIASSPGFPGADYINPSADLQNGPDGVRVVYEHDQLGDIILDELFYGERPDDCDAGEGQPAAKPGQDISLARLPDGYDSDDNASDFALCDTPTPGAANDCDTTVVTGCTFAQPMLINEILVGAASDGEIEEFIELVGPPGANLSCYRIEGINGKGCESYREIQLSGTVASDGIVVVGKTDTVPNVDLADGGADLQNGPDALRLVYVHDDDGLIVLDSLAYGVGDDLAGCGTGEGNPAPKPNNGQSLSRIPDGQDSDDNAADFALCDFPSPGQENRCTGPEGCLDPVPSLVINELFIRTDGDKREFIELYGTPGAPLGCFTLSGTNGSNCETYQKTSLTGFMPSDGYLVVGASDAVPNYDLVDSDAALQVGPDALDLVYNHTESGPIVVDRVVYGGSLADCGVAEGSPAPDADKEFSLARVPNGNDSDDNGSDFQVCDTPTPGDANHCSAAPCSADPMGLGLVINEILVSSTTDGPLVPFVEIKGPAGTDLSCVYLTGINGSSCSLYNKIELEGSIDADGYFLIAKDASIPDANMTSSKADYQSGPDGLDLVYAHATMGDIVMDALAYGEGLEDCTAGEGSLAPDPGKDSSLARAPDGADSGDNAVDFVVCAAPSPGAENMCEGSDNPDPGDPNRPTSKAGASCAMGDGHGMTPLAFLFAVLLVFVTRRRRV